MNKTSDYNIVFKSLKDGIHHFKYTITPAFFGEIENSIIDKGNFEVSVVLNKKPQLLQFDFEFEGQVESICDNCLDAVTTDISNESTIYVKFGDEYDEPSEEIIILPREENEINLAQLIYEIIVVSLPLRMVHENEDDCNQEMISKLDKHSYANSEDDKAIDPRWEALKKLKNNSNT